MTAKPPVNAKRVPSQRRFSTAWLMTSLIFSLSGLLFAVGGLLILLMAHFQFGFAPKEDSAYLVAILATLVGGVLGAIAVSLSFVQLVAVSQLSQFYARWHRFAIVIGATALTIPIVLMVTYLLLVAYAVVQYFANPGPWR